MTARPSDILDFWFEGNPGVSREKWFEKDAAFDTACARFTADIRAARDGAYDAWAGTSEGALALILVMDQLSRNVFRGTAEAFAADPHALAIARAAIARGYDQVLTPRQRMFFYLPFEHSENMQDQDESVRLFDTVREALGRHTVDYAARHRDVIREFGRFPHRNTVLGRIGTAEEKAYSARPGAGF